MRIVFLALAGVLSLLGSGSPKPVSQVLYGPIDGPITAFAQNGSLLGWFAPGVRSCNTVHVLSLNGVEATLPTGTSNVTCRWDMVGPAPQIAIASGSASTLWTLHERATTEFDYVVGASVQEPTERRFSEIAHSKAGAGLWLGGIAGDGTTLVYSVAGVSYVNQIACLSGGSCAEKVSGGGVHLVVGRKDPLIPNTGPALQVAAAAGRIAYVPAVTVVNGVPEASPTRPIEIRDAETGSLVATALPGGTPVSLALSANVLAVLVRTADGLQIAWFDAGHGTQLGSVRVSKKTAPRISTNDQTIVYRVGRSVRGITVGTGAITKIVTTPTTPIGLSLAGSRLAWAENVGGQGSIHAIFLRGRG